MLAYQTNLVKYSCMQEIKALTQFNFYSELEQRAGLSLVYFTADSCASCRHLSLILKQLQQQRADISIYKIDAQQDQALVTEYEVFHLPALFLFKDGHYHAELHCEARLTSIEQAVEAANIASAEEAP